MHHLSTQRDFNYKYIVPESSMYLQEKSNIIISIWTIDRLSLIRSTIFIDRYFNNHITKKQTIYLKYSRTIKKKKTKTRLVIVVPVHDFNKILTIIPFLPEPRYLMTPDGCLFVFHFHHFTLRIPVSIKKPVFIYKLLPYILYFFK